MLPASLRLAIAGRFTDGLGHYGSWRLLTDVTRTLTAPLARFNSWRLSEGDMLMLSAAAGYEVSDKVAIKRFLMARDSLPLGSRTPHLSRRRATVVSSLPPTLPGPLLDC